MAFAMGGRQPASFDWPLYFLVLAFSFGVMGRLLERHGFLSPSQARRELMRSKQAA